MQPKELTLRFTEWSCGHHATRPSDIQVQSPEQAMQICIAISCAISQPGSARAVVMDETYYFDVYITDDYAAAGHSSSATPPPSSSWLRRPTVIHGRAEDIEAIHSDALQAALDDLHGPTDRLDAAGYVDAGAVVTTTLSLDELTRMAAPVDWHENGRRKRFEAPPEFLPAGNVLKELRALQADIDAEDAELAEQKSQEQAQKE